MRYEYRHNIENWRGPAYECPVCHSENVETDDSGPEDDYYYYDMYCEDCGAVFKQWYRMEPSEICWCTKEEAEEQERAVPNYTYSRDTYTITMPSTASILAASSSVIATTTSSGHWVWAPAHDDIRHNYDLAPDFGEDKRIVPPPGYPPELHHDDVSDNPLLDILSSAYVEADASVTRNLLLGRIDWEAVARSLQEE